jgi:hypothetical protein
MFRPDATQPAEANGRWPQTTYGEKSIPAFNTPSPAPEASVTYPSSVDSTSAHAHAMVDGEHRQAVPKWLRDLWTAAAR